MGQDASLWTNTGRKQVAGLADDRRRPDCPRRRIQERSADEIEKAGFTHCGAFGHGRLQPLRGSFRENLRHDSRAIRRFHVLDSTDPAQIRTIDKNIDIAKTIFIVASKSGSTLEPNIFKQYFYERVNQAVGAGGSGKALYRHHRSRFAHAESGRGGRLPAHIFYGVPSIGGRYSALSNFGMIPAAIQGVDMPEVSGSRRGNGAARAARRCRRMKIPARFWARFWAPRRNWAATR